MLRLVSLFVVVAAVGCAPLTIQQQPAASLKGVSDVAFVGAYDGRVLMGGVQTTKQVTTMGAMPVYGAGGYAGTVYYPQSTTVRTGELAPNDAVRLVAEGFESSVDGGSVNDLASTAPLEARSEMGLDWFSRTNPTLPNLLVSVEVKSASVSLDDARSNYTLGLTAMTLGIMSPCLACTTAPCLLYPLAAKTRASAEASGTLRVFDKKTSTVVLRAPLSAQSTVEADGFHNPEDVFRELSTEVGHRLGIQAASQLKAFLDHAGVPPDRAAPTPAPTPTPSLERPAGSAPPPPAGAL